MIKTFTEDDLIRYVYGETSEVESLEIESTLLCDNAEQERVTQFKEVKQNLDQIALAPSENCVNDLLSKVKNLTLQSFTK